MRYKEFGDGMVPKWEPYNPDGPSKYWIIPIRLHGQTVLPYLPKNSILTIQEQTIADHGSSFSVEPLGMNDGWLLMFDCKGTIIIDAPDYPKAQKILQGLIAVHWDDVGRVVPDEFYIEEAGSVTTIGDGRVMRLNRLYDEVGYED